MSNNILIRNTNEYQQLISIGISLVHNIFLIVDKYPELLGNNNISKILKLATEWNETFIEIITSREGR